MRPCEDGFPAEVHDQPCGRPSARSVALLMMMLGIPPADRGAILTSRYPTYAVGEAIDLIAWIRSDVGPASIDIRMLNGEERAVAERAEKGRELAEIVRAAGKPGANARVVVPDLRRWFAIDQPGEYQVRLIGPDGKRVLAGLRIPVRPSVVGAAIPLNRIWALDMPGTRPMNRKRSGDSTTYEAPEGPIVDEIRAALRFSPDRGAIGPTFAVPGQGLDALRAARDVLARGKPRPSAIEFLAGGPITLVFFSREFSAYVHLARVERRGDDVQISYRFVPHRTKELSTHIALIPLPANSSLPGRVEIKPVIDQNMTDIEWAAWTAEAVCRSFPTSR